MPRSSQKSPQRAPLALGISAGLLLSFTIGCSSSTTMSQAEPDVEPQVQPQVSQTGEPGDSSGAVERRSREPIASLLQGRTAGVIVTETPGGGISVRIRGAHSFYAGSEPLYIVDGTPFTPGPGGALTGINPEDIESIEVLKGPPETTLYGVRGANGVVIVKTKRPGK